MCRFLTFAAAAALSVFVLAVARCLSLAIANLLHLFTSVSDVNLHGPAASKLYCERDRLESEGSLERHSLYETPSSNEDRGACFTGRF